MEYKIELIEHHDDDIYEYLREGLNGSSYFLFRINELLVDTEVDFTQYGYEWPTLLDYESHEVIDDKEMTRAISDYLDDISIEAMMLAKYN